MAKATKILSSAQRQVIVFNILNSAATQLEGLHNVSDAGAGQDLMHLTPTRDSEFISTGRPQTPFTVAPVPTAMTQQGLLDNGGISPAVLSRALLLHLSSLGFDIQFRSFNFCVALPQGEASDWIDSCIHYGGDDHYSRAEVTEHLQRELELQARSGHISIVAECGVGGTTFSTLWLRLLTGVKVSPAGSTRDTAKLKQKALLIQELESEYALLQSGFEVEALFANSRFHDEIQAAIYQLMSQWPQELPLPRFAGGMMFVAPLIAALKNSDNKCDPDQSGYIDTTRWVCGEDEGKALKPVFDMLPHAWAVRVNQTRFSASRYSCLQVFENGIVVEGCGFGGLLVLAEELGIKQRVIVDVLEQACEQHIKQCVAKHKPNAA